MYEKAPFSRESVEKKVVKTDANAVEQALAPILDHKDQDSLSLHIPEIVGNIRKMNNMSFEIAQALIDAGYAELVLDNLGKFKTFENKASTEDRFPDQVVWGIFCYLLDHGKESYILTMHPTGFLELSNEHTFNLINRLLERDEKFWELFGNSEVLDKVVYALHYRRYNAQFAAMLTEKGYSSEIIDTIDHVIGLRSHKKKLVERLIQEGDRQLIVKKLWKLAEVSDIPEEELIQTLLQLGYLNELVLEKTFHKQETENRVVEAILDSGDKDAVELMIASFKEREGLSLDIAFRAIELGYASSILRYRKSFEKIDGEMMVKIIDSLPEEQKALALQEVYSEYEETFRPDHAKIMIDAGYGALVAGRTISFHYKNGEHNAIVHMLMQAGFDEEVEKNIIFFLKLSAETVEDIIRTRLNKGQKNISQRLLARISPKSQAGSIKNIAALIGRKVWSWECPLTPETARMLVQTGFYEEVFRDDHRDTFPELPQDVYKQHIKWLHKARKDLQKISYLGHSRTPYESMRQRYPHLNDKK